MTTVDSTIRDDASHSFEDHVLGLYEELYRYPCFSQWPPTAESVIARGGSSPKVTRKTFAALESQGTFDSIRAKYLDGPIRDPSLVPQDILGKAIMREVMDRSRDAKIRSTDMVILIGWWSSLAVDGRDPTGKDEAANVAAMIRLSPRRVKEGLKKLALIGLLEPLMFPTADGAVEISRDTE